MIERIKPKRIIEIENILGYKIYEEPLSAIYFSKSLTCYALNKQGKVIGFKIRYAISKYKDISFLKILTDLRALNISHSCVEEINLDFIASFKKLNYLYAIGNPIKNIPKEIYNREANVLEDVRTYLKSLKGELQYLHQAKLLLIGNGEVGKSSIRIKLMDEKGTLPEKHERTQGLEIAKYTIKNLSTSLTKLNTDIDFDLFIWDFGGQGKYREVQQLFCSRQALYIYVTSVDDKPTKEDYVGFEYWFSMANAFGYDKKEDWQSPIIYVLNKCDIEKKAIDEVSVYNTFNNVHEFVKISCYSLDNFEMLKKAIASALQKVNKDIFTSQFNKKWFDVNREIEKFKSDNYISIDTYIGICSSKGLNIQEANLWLDYLDRIGILIYFRDNPELNTFIILNPLWVRDSVYKVLDSPLTKDNILKEEYFNFIWHNYNEFEHQKLLALMLTFKFCYSQINNQGHKYYIVPALLPGSQPNLPVFLQEFTYEIRFKYVPFIPAGTVNKLIVDLKEFIYQDLIWKHNCILHLTQGKSISFAHVVENWQEKTVSLKLSGSKITAIYNLIYNELKLLIKDLKEIKFLDNLEIEIEAKYKGEFISLKNIKNHYRSEFYFLFESEESFNFDNNTKQVNVNKIPTFFLSELEKQIVEQYKELLRYRFLKNNEIDFKKRVNFQEEIELRETNIYEIEDNFLKLIKNEKLLLTESEILSQIENIKQSIYDRLDKIENTLIKSSEVQTEITEKIDFFYDKIITELENHKIFQSRIEEIIQNIKRQSKYAIEKTSLEIAEHINYAFEHHRDKLDEKLLQQYEQLQQTDDWSTKLKLTVPFLNLIGVNLEHEVDLKKYIKWLQNAF